MAAVATKNLSPCIGLLRSLPVLIPGSHRFCSSGTAVDKVKKNKPLSAYKKGRGGRSSFNGVVATVFGASGFLGRYVVNQLGKIGTQVIVPYRGPEYDVEHLKLCGDLGQILYAPYCIKDEESLRKAMKYSNVVINLTGRDWETKNFSYDDIHNQGAGLIAKIAAEMGVERLIHLSSLNASLDPEPTVQNKTSKFLISKAMGEKTVREYFPEAIIMRPADMWGDEDRFFRYWASRFRRHRNTHMPLWNRGEMTVKQPVDVVNVAQGIIKAMTDKDTPGATFECVGPKSYYQADLIDYFYDEMRWDHMPRVNIRPNFLMKARMCELIFPATPPLVMDKIVREAVSDRLTGCPTLEDLGVELSPFEDAARYQLKVFKRGRYYAESLGEVSCAPEPPTAAEQDEARKVYF